MPRNDGFECPVCESFVQTKLFLALCIALSGYIVYQLIKYWNRGERK